MKPSRITCQHGLLNAKPKAWVGPWSSLGCLKLFSGAPGITAGAEDARSLELNIGQRLLEVAGVASALMDTTQSGVNVHACTVGITCAQQGVSQIALTACLLSSCGLSEVRLAQLNSLLVVSLQCGEKRAGAQKMHLRLLGQLCVSDGQELMCSLRITPIDCCHSLAGNGSGKDLSVQSRGLKDP